MCVRADTILGMYDTISRSQDLQTCTCVCAHMKAVRCLTWQLGAWNVLPIEVGQVPKVLDCTVATGDRVWSQWSPQMVCVTREDR